MEMNIQQVAKLLRTRPADAHKGTMGHALLVAGSRGMAGCAILAAESCLRSGVGKLSVATEELNYVPLHIAVPESILRKAESRDLPNEAMQFQSMGIGPGMGTGKASLELLQHLAEQTNAPAVVDADALHLLAENPALATCFAGRAILTPHPGEMKHLAEGFALNEENLQESAQQIAQKEQLVVVLKGHPTFVFLPDGKISSCPRGNAGMATAGSGDVLTGLITGLLAQGHPLADAAILGVWLHATAGDRASKELGEECMLARDIVTHLPQAFAELKIMKE